MTESRYLRVVEEEEGSVEDESLMVEEELTELDTLRLMNNNSSDITKYFGKNKLLTLKNLLRFPDDFDLLGFWSNKLNQRAYPGIYKLVHTTMAYMASTAFVESVFSIAGRLITPRYEQLRRKNLEGHDCLQGQVSH